MEYEAGVFFLPLQFSSWIRAIVGFEIIPLIQFLGIYCTASSIIKVSNLRIGKKATIQEL